MGDQGFDVIPLDLSTVPESIDHALDEAAGRYRTFVDLAGSVLGHDAPIFRETLTLMSFINRASSLHKGIVCAVRESNPHSAFTLLRAYLELVVTVHYVDKNPDYVAALERPMAELPRGTRLHFADLFKAAASEMRGVRAVYRELSEIGHFGSTAMWHPFNVDERDGRSILSFYSGPRWKRDGDARIVLAMLKECDDGVLEVIARYSNHHVQPLLERQLEKEKIKAAFVSAGVTPTEEGIGFFSGGLGASAQAAGLVEWCEEHQALELVKGTSAEDVEAWAAAMGDAPS